jgi:hypothetical protein
MELKFMMPSTYTDKTTRYYDLQDVIFGVGAVSTDFNVDYHLDKVPSFNGLTFSLINMSGINADEHDYNFVFEPSNRIMHFITRPGENKLENTFKSLQSCVIEPQFEVALFDHDNYGDTKIEGFMYFDLKNDAYEGVIFILNHVVEESIAKMEKDRSLTKIITCNDFTSINVEATSMAFIYDVTIRAYADKVKEV